MGQHTGVLASTHAVKTTMDDGDYCSCQPDLSMKAVRVGYGNTLFIHLKMQRGITDP